MTTTLHPRIMRLIEPQIATAREMLAAGASPAEIVDECGSWAAAIVGIDVAAVPRKHPRCLPPARYRRRYGIEMDAAL